MLTGMAGDGLTSSCAQSTSGTTRSAWLSVVLSPAATLGPSMKLGKAMHLHSATTHSRVTHVDHIHLPHSHGASSWVKFVSGAHRQRVDAQRAMSSLGAVTCSSAMKKESHFGEHEQLRERTARCARGNVPVLRGGLGRCPTPCPQRAGQTRSQGSL